MSGHFYIKNPTKDIHTTSNKIASLLSIGGEKICHYQPFNDAAIGHISNDAYAQGIMPRVIDSGRFSGSILGTLYPCDYNDDLKKYYNVLDNLNLFIELYKDSKLMKHLPQMNGAYSVIIYDSLIDELIVINDRFGMYPLYWSGNWNCFTVASRVFASVIAGSVKSDLNLSGIAQLLVLDDHLDETTMVKDVKALPPATILKLNDSKLSINTYWHYEYSNSLEKMNIIEIAEKLGFLLDRSIFRQIGNIDKVGVTLSGGLDSRCLLSGSLKKGSNVHSITWGKKDSFDRAIASNVSNSLGAIHHDYDYNINNIEHRYHDVIRATEGHINFFDCHMAFHLDYLKNYPIILNGFAGDLIMGGSYMRNPWRNVTIDEKKADLLFRWKTNGIDENAIDSFFPMIKYIPKEEMPSSLFKKTLLCNTCSKSANKVDRFFLENRVRRQCAMGTVLMRYVTESAAPFFDYELVDYLTAIPDSLRYEHRIYLEMMKLNYPNATKLRWQRTLLPARAPRFLNIPMKALLKGAGITEKIFHYQNIHSRLSPVDFPKWLRGPLKDWMYNIMISDNTNDSLISDDFCKKVFLQHQAGQNMTQIFGKIASIRGVEKLIYDISLGSKTLNQVCLKKIRN